jgi:hypothetical protein
LDVLTTVEAGIILPDHARSSGKRYPYEALFKSITRLLIDNASSEYIFTTEFFSDPRNPSPHDSLLSFFSQVFEASLKFVESGIRNFIDGTYDAIGLLFCIRVNSQNIRIMQKRRLPHLGIHVCFSPNPLYRIIPQSLEYPTLAPISNYHGLSL